MPQKMHLIQKHGVKLELDLHDRLKNFEKEKHYTIPVFIPHKGCRNECVFCNQRKISGVVVTPTCEEVEEIIQKHLEYIKDKKDDASVEVAFFGGSFTGLNINDQIDYLKVAHKYIELKKVSGIRISTRPDYIKPLILNILKKYGVTTIELGVQSMDNMVLQAAKRGHLNTDTIRASKLIKIWGFNLGHQIMVGLPKSTLISEKQTMESVIKMSPKELRIYPVYVLEDSELYEMYKKGIYKALSIEEAVSRVVEIVKLCQTTNIKIIRLGLQSTDEITSKSSHIYGPVCDNFAEYVMAEIAKEEMEKIILSKKLESKEEIIFQIPKKFVSIVIGPKKINKDYFKNKYNIKIGVSEI